MPSAFISYSRDNEKLQLWVEALAGALRLQGIDVLLDEWVLYPGDDLMAFMEQSVAQSDYVICILTPEYKRKADSRTGGVGKESAAIVSELFAKMNERKVIPLLVAGDSVQSVPLWAKHKVYLDFRAPDGARRGFQRLVRALFQELGPPSIKELASIRHQQSFAGPCRWLFAAPFEGYQPSDGTRGGPKATPTVGREDTWRWDYDAAEPLKNDIVYFMLYSHDADPRPNGLWGWGRISTTPESLMRRSVGVTALEVYEPPVPPLELSCIQELSPFLFSVRSRLQTLLDPTSHMRLDRLITAL